MTVKKEWVLDDGGKRTDSVTVELLCGDRVYQTVKLSEDNNWTCTWKDLDGGCSWKVRETDVPEGFIASVEREGNIFTIVNDDKPSVPDKPDVPDTPDKPDKPDDGEGGENGGSDNSGSHSSSGSSGSGSSGSSSAAAPVKEAKTGDSANPLLWTGLALTAVLVIGGTVVYKRRKEDKK